MNKIICYINDNYIDIKKNNLIYHKVLESLKNGHIIDTKLFIKELEKTKLFNSILTNNIEVFVNKKIIDEDIVLYKYIFNELNESSVVVSDTRSKLQDYTLIDNGENYILFIGEYYEFNKLFLYLYIDYFNIEKLKIISSKKIVDYNLCKYLYFNNFNTYFID